MKELKFNLKYLLTRKELYFAILIIFLINIIHVFMVIQYTNGTLSLVENTYSASYQSILYNTLVPFNTIIIIVLPIVSSMILSDATWVENNRKISHLLFTRIDKKRNHLARYCLSFLVPFIICFLAFALNYFLLTFLFEDGMTVSYFQSVAFYENIYPEHFMDLMRYQNPVFYIFILNLIVSFFIGLLSAFTYSISLFIKKRIFIYIIPLILLILLELILPWIHLGNLSILRFLQPLTSFTLWDILIAASIIIVISFILLFYKMKKTDQLI